LFLVYHTAYISKRRIEVKVILIQDVPDLGREGEVKNVAPGYARNFLIPNKLAVVATPGQIKALQAQQKAQHEREARMAAQAAVLAKKMAETTLVFEAKAGPGGRLYGSITTADIAEALSKELGMRFEKRNILSEPLRQVGEHAVAVRISRTVQAQLRVLVKGEGAEFVEAVAAPAAEAAQAGDRAGLAEEGLLDEEAELA
jgi:large subunit ribosomal protein L9